MDRGSPVPLKAQLGVMKIFDPLLLTVKGNVPQSAVINNSVSFIGRFYDPVKMHQLIRFSK